MLWQVVYIVLTFIVFSQCFLPGNKAAGTQYDRDEKGNNV